MPAISARIVGQFIDQLRGVELTLDEARDLKAAIDQRTRINVPANQVLLAPHTVATLEDELTHQRQRGATLEGDRQQSLGDFLVYTDKYLDDAKLAYAGFPIDIAHSHAVISYVKVGALVAAFLNSRG